MRYLAIDPGVQRVGLALTDPGGSMAFPYKTIHRTTRKALFEELTAVIDAEKVGTVVVGLPLGLDGQETESTRQARNMAARLSRRVDIPVKMMDETLSSFEAEEDLAAMGVKAHKRKAVLDQQAAVRILQSYLDAQGRNVT